MDTSTISAFLEAIFIIYLVFQGLILSSMHRRDFSEVTIPLKSVLLHACGLFPARQCGRRCIMHLAVTSKASSAPFPDVKSAIAFCQTYSMVSYLLELPKFHPLSSPVTCAELMRIVFVRSKPLSACNKTNKWKGLNIFN